MPDIAPAQIDAGAAHLSVHIAGADLVEVLGAVDGLTVENHLLHALSSLPSPPLALAAPRSLAAAAPPCRA